MALLAAVAYSVGSPALSARTRTGRGLVDVWFVRSCVRVLCSRGCRSHLRRVISCSLVSMVCERQVFVTSELWYPSVCAMSTYLFLGFWSPRRCVVMPDGAVGVLHRQGIEMVPRAEYSEYVKGFLVSVSRV